MRAARSRRWPLRAALSVAASEARAERTWRARQRRHSPRPRGGCQCAPLMGAISLARDLTRLGASGGLEAAAGGLGAARRWPMATPELAGAAWARLMRCRGCQPTHFTVYRCMRVFSRFGDLPYMVMSTYDQIFGRAVF